MKKKVLIAYPELYLGGSTTSLISLLNSFDYSKYDVDLVLNRKKGEYLKDIPKEVNILDEAARFKKSHFFDMIIFFLVYFIKGYLLKALFTEKKYKKRFGFNQQILSQYSAKSSFKIDKDYDVAIGYLEYWANDYVLNFIKAKKKIAWIHTDYKSAGFIPELDIKTFSKATNIVCVSPDCKTSFISAFPTLKNRVVYMGNIISKALVVKKSNEIIHDFDNSFKGLKIITVSRLSIKTKGYDRIIFAAKKLVQEGYKFQWLIIGDGPDRNNIEQLIRENSLEKFLVLIGKRKNPYPYMVKCDIFAMPSRYEGKPIAVTEAQILGLPIIVTNYNSAKKQVINGTDGLVVENNDESIFFGIKKVLDNPDLVELFKINIAERKLSNEEEIKKLYCMME